MDARLFAPRQIPVRAYGNLQPPLLNEARTERTAVQDEADFAKSLLDSLAHCTRLPEESFRAFDRLPEGSHQSVQLLDHLGGVLVCEDRACDGSRHGCQSVLADHEKLPRLGAELWRSSRSEPKQAVVHVLGLENRQAAVGTRAAIAFLLGTEEKLQRGEAIDSQRPVRQRYFGWKRGSRGVGEILVPRDQQFPVRDLRHGSLVSRAAPPVQHPLTHSGGRYLLRHQVELADDGDEMLDAGSGLDSLVLLGRKRGKISPRQLVGDFLELV
mmetsp:Transcript_14844/g.56174  ORF Transcript_14844/g.56174 Transcript_14844/m.56174 type:complete len:270 (+) Transcript_14844:8339-9148(+)